MSCLENLIFQKPYFSSIILTKYGLKGIFKLKKMIIIKLAIVEFF